MKYFETEHERNSARITALITAIILVLLFVIGAPYMDPPEEYGVVINFGTTNFGKGKIESKKPIKSELQKVNESPQPETLKVNPTTSTEAKEEVLTQEDAKEIAIKKQKETQAKAEADRIAKEKREQNEKKKKLDALIGGVSKSEDIQTGSEGNDNKAGDKGQLDGDPYAPSYFGDSATGSGDVGYGLNGRGRATYNKLKQDCNESGMVIVRIVVNKNGNVVEATPGVKGTTNTAKCLLDPAEKIALSHKWSTNFKAPTKQIGFVKVNFKLGQ